MLLSVFQQFVGINVIFYYSTILWEAVGFSEEQSFVITVISAIINMLTTLIAIATIDRIGRKPLLVIGSVGMTDHARPDGHHLRNRRRDRGDHRRRDDGTPDLSTALFGGASAPIALVAANLFVIAFGMSWGPVVWVLLGEMFPNRMRAAALSLAAGGQWVANWLVTVSFPVLRDFSLGFAYGLYARSPCCRSSSSAGTCRRQRANSWRTCTPDACRGAPRPSRRGVFVVWSAVDDGRRVRPSSGSGDRR